MSQWRSSYFMWPLHYHRSRLKLWHKKRNCSWWLYSFNNISVLASVSICYLDQGLSFGRNDMDSTFFTPFRWPFTRLFLWIFLRQESCHHLNEQSESNLKRSKLQHTSDHRNYILINWNGSCLKKPCNSTINQFQRLNFWLFRKVFKLML